MRNIFQNSEIISFGTLKHFFFLVIHKQFYINKKTFTNINFAPDNYYYIYLRVFQNLEVKIEHLFSRTLTVSSLIPLTFLLEH